KAGQNPAGSPAQAAAPLRRNENGRPKAPVVSSCRFRLRGSGGRLVALRGGRRLILLLVRVVAARLRAELADAAAQRTTQTRHAARPEEQREDDQDDQEFLPAQASDHSIPLPVRPI